jgi:hypothetical protein
MDRVYVVVDKYTNWSTALYVDWAVSMAGARQLLAGTGLRFITRPTKSFYT